jgi:hypothetical protein
MTVRFSAQLEDEYGNIIETGTAELVSDPDSLNFNGGFIPLYRIGEKITVVRMLNNRRLEVLRGEVFLSSRNLLRVTGIDSASMENIRRIFLSNTQFEARPYLTAKKRFQNKLAKIYEAEAIVYYLSETEIKFLSMDPLRYGQVLTLDLDEPLTLRGASIEIRETVDFGSIMKAYLCRFAGLSDEDTASLTSYVKAIVQDDEPIY